jgi:hypothetical protein
MRASHFFGGLLSGDYELRTPGARPNLDIPSLKPVSGGKYKMLFGITVGMIASHNK